ncbi:MAG TPA: hypothetical protein VHP55_13270, partial [Usitatibacter sp.]|nr:hypothetical protein [Usitatibacter sp.]
DEIVTLDGPLGEAAAGTSVMVVLDRQVDLARGDLLSHTHDAPAVGRRLDARLAWLDREPLALGRRYWLKHGTRMLRATVEELHSRLDLETLESAAQAPTLEFNDLGAARIALAGSLAADRYADNRATGSFILVDDATHQTVAGGMISEVLRG